MKTSVRLWTMTFGLMTLKKVKSKASAIAIIWGMNAVKEMVKVKKTEIKNQSFHRFIALNLTKSSAMAVAKRIATIIGK